MQFKHQQSILSFLFLSLLVLTTANLVISSRFDTRNQATTPTTPTKINPPQGVAPIFYVMHDLDFTAPANAKALGGWYWITWAQLETAEGQYNWALIEDRLQKNSAINRPTALSILLLPDVHQIAVPTWVQDLTGRPTVDPDGTGPCPPVVRPVWESPILLEKFSKMIAALGQKYENDPRLNSVWIASGLYGENVSTGSHSGGLCSLKYNVGANTLGNFVVKLPQIYRTAFPTKPLFIINSAPTGRLELTKQALTLSPPLGIKHNALEFDLPDQNGSDNDQWRTINYYWQQVAQNNLAGMVGFEHFFANSPTHIYWGLLAGLSRHMTLIDLPKDHLATVASMQNQFNATPATRANSADLFPLWSFVENHFARTTLTTPTVWAVLRDTAYATGEPGDWEFYLYRPDNIDGQHFRRNSGQDRTVVVKSADLPEPAKTSLIGRNGTSTVRRTDVATGNPYMYFHVDDNWSAIATTGFDIEITYLDLGTDSWELKYGPNSDQKIVVTKLDTKKFIRQKFSLPSLDLKQKINSAGDNFRIDAKDAGDEYIHMVQIIPHNWQAPTWDLTNTSLPYTPPPTSPPSTSTPSLQNVTPTKSADTFTTHTFFISYFGLTPIQVSELNWSIPVTIKAANDYHQNYYPQLTFSNSKLSFSLDIPNNFTNFNIIVSGPQHLPENYHIANASQTDHNLSTPTILPGDVYGPSGRPDQTINAIDFSYLKSQLNLPQFDPIADLDHNGKINSVDIGLFLLALTQLQNRIF